MYGLIALFGVVVLGLWCVPSSTGQGFGNLPAFGHNVVDMSGHASVNPLAEAATADTPFVQESIVGGINATDASNGTAHHHQHHHLTHESGEAPSFKDHVLDFSHGGHFDFAKAQNFSHRHRDHPERAKAEAAAAGNSVSD